MILAVDIGNSNIVLGALGDEVRLAARVGTDRRKTADEYAVLFSALLDMHGAGRVFEGAVVASVVPPLTNPVRGAVARVTGRTPLVVGPGIKSGLNIRIDNPGQLGSDLVADAVAAAAQYEAPLILFDMGTATTVSVIGRGGVYLGGAIVPGVKTSLDALSSDASQLPHISLERPKRVIGTNTVDCMKSGAVFSSAAMIDGMAARIEKELGEPATVVATGGLARFIVPYCERKVVCDELLLLKGLKIIYEKNVSI